MNNIAHVIDAVITLRDQLSGTLKNVNGNLSQFQRQATYAGRNMVAVGKDMEKVGKTLSKTITVPILAVGAGLLKLGENFQKAQNTIRVGTGATGKDLQNLSDDFKATYTQVSSSMDDTSKVIADLNTRTGLAGKPLQDLSVQMLKLAKISGEDLNTLIPATTRMFQDAGIKQADYSKALDYTFKVSQTTGIGVGRLQELMTQFGGPLRQMGFDWQTSGAMLGKFEKEGVNTELVVGSLRIALGKMAKEGIKEPAKELQGMIDKIKSAGTAGQANALALSMFGAKAGPDMAAAIREGRMDLSELMQTLKDSPETINKAAADTATFSGKLAKMRHVMEVAFAPVSEKLLNSLENLTPYLKTASDAVAGFAKKIAEMPPATQAAILKYALMAAAAGPVILTLGKVVHSIGDTIGTFTKMSRTIADAGGLMKYLATPGGIAIVVLLALAAAAILVTTHWDLIKKKFNDFRQALKDNETAIRNVAIAIGVVFGPALIAIGAQAVITGAQIVGGLIASVISAGVEAGISAAVFTGQMIVSLISFALQAWKTVAVLTIQIGLFIAQRLGMISAAEATGIITAAQWLFNAAMDANPIGVVILALAALGLAIYEVVKHWQDICEWVSKAWDWLTKWNGTKAEDKTVNVTTNTTSDGMKAGRNALGTSYWGGGRTLVGEHGAEEVDLPKGTRIKDARSTLNSSGNSISIPKLADTIIVREEADIDKIANALVLKINATATNMA
ncbi:phage tail tape measure protein [Desulfosporosinus sp. Sb-LF]|uniref:phage tail tape measure protein n=1 Tax=Desulfosporosinus sp. Sb-LF TaxID=2560027 RepID=UPI00107F834F|nr:phage tail tape measure protein [Desulfosporosinus sp. Sb-LF]TGE33322.1 phage tail tape measure protein [Desulfosporosinus sp. Sb-LF]